MKSAARALRRHHRERLKNTRREYWAGNASVSPRNRGQITKTPCMCSDWCCGNPRRHFGELTIQERRAVAV